MRVFAVIMEDGTIYSLYKDINKARETQKKLDSLYEDATVKEMNVE